MGLVIRDDRQMKALTGVSQAQFDFLLPVFSHVYQKAQQQRYEDGVEAGTRSRKPGAGIKGKLPTMANKLTYVLYYYKTYPDSTGLCGWWNEHLKTSGMVQLITPYCVKHNPT
jgi:hypothetical protein